ncbi:MAG: glycosyltransferase [Proteobacteria bacterium]|nr:MAG: glycosyltransferase [Pseudomonadota bacterium]
MKVAFLSVDGELLNISELESKFKRTAPPVTDISVISKDTDTSGYDFVFVTSRLLRSLDERFDAQISFMKSRNLDASSCDIFLDNNRKKQGGVEHPGCMVFTGRAYALLFPSFSVPSALKDHSWAKYLHWDMPLAVAAPNLHRSGIAFMPPAKSFLTFPKVRFKLIAQAAQMIARLISLSISERTLASFAFSDMLRRSNSRPRTIRKPLSRAIDIEHLIFLPYPGIGGADQSNVKLLESRGVNLERSLVVFTQGNPELTTWQAASYEDLFADSHYLCSPERRYSEPWSVLDAMLASANLKSIHVYASDFGARYCEHVRQRDPSISTTVILHNRLIGGWLGHAIEYRSAWNSLIVVSEEIRDHLVLYGFDSAKISVAYLDRILLSNTESMQTPAPRSGDTLQIGFVGRLDRDKGIYELINLAEICRTRAISMRFIIIGTGAEAQYFLSEIGKKMLGEYFIFLGQLERVSTEYTKLDGLISLSRVEGISLVAMEAIHHRVPVFSTPAGELPEYKVLRNLTEQQLSLSPAFSGEMLSTSFFKWLSSLQFNLSLARDILAEPMLLKESGQTFEVPYILTLIHRVRSGFDKDLPLHTDQGRAAFLYWWVTYGFAEYHFSSPFLSPANVSAFHQSSGNAVGPLTWSRLAYEAYRWHHSDILERHLNPGLTASEGDQLAIEWFYAIVVPARNLWWLLTSEQREFMAARTQYSGDESDWLDNFMLSYHNADVETRNVFPILTVDQRRVYRNWFLDDKNPDRSRSRFYEPKAAPEVMVQPPTSAGVNVIGLSGSASGVGEDARMAIQALTKNGVSSVAIGFNTKENFAAAKYNINLYCLTGFQLLLSRATAGAEFMNERFNVGYFPWELPDWPNELIPALDMCQELWVSSQFIYDSISRFTKTPLRLMPMAVEVPNEIWSYQAENPRNEPLVRFIFIFDVRSGLSRKNVWRCLELFQKSFIDGEAVELIIKSMNFNESDPDSQKLQKIVESDPRIIHIPEVLSRLDVLKLICDSDVFLSLHRAEGFGRGIAESLLLGKHVVATNYSGNLEFTKPDHSFLVDYDLIPVTSEEYVFSHNQVWADPKTDSAIQAIRQSYNAVKNGNRYNIAGQTFMRTYFSAAHVGELYASRLSELGLI